MKSFKGEITLNKNSRGCYILDTVKGCSMCSIEKPNGCYDNCYANNIAKRYGFNFKKPIKRDISYNREQLFLFDIHCDKDLNRFIKNINDIKMPFVRIGEMGDQSQDWKHTIEICKIISESKKHIVIITKHLKKIPDILLKEIEKLNICINTSISALDENHEIKYRLNKFNMLKNYCNSILRIVSCNFNIKNKEGNYRNETQKKLFINDKIIDTIFRPNVNNYFVTKGIIKTKKVKFLKSFVLASIYNEKTYFGNCAQCPDMCGLNK